MKQVEFYQAILRKDLSDEVMAYAQRNYNGLTTPTEGQLENEKIAKAILEDETLVSFYSRDIAWKFLTSTSRAAIVLKSLFEEGKLTRERDYRVNRYKYTKVSLPMPKEVEYTCPVCKKTVEKGVESCWHCEQKLYWNWEDEE